MGKKVTNHILWSELYTPDYIVSYLFCLAVIGTQTRKDGKEVKHWIQDFSIPQQNDRGFFVANVLIDHENCGKIMFFTFDEIQFFMVQDVHTLEAVMYMPLDTFSDSSELSTYYKVVMNVFE